MKNKSLPSVMNHSFSRVPKVEVPRSTFDRSCTHKTTFDSGFLVPIYIDEALPGDTFNLSMSAFARLTTPIVPIMDNLFLETFWFFVPNRLVWSNWVKLNGEQEDPGDSTDFLTPQVDIPASTVLADQSVFDYFGIPPITVGADGLSVNALPFRAYNLIYNEWFRDQNLNNSLDVSKGDGPDAPATYTLQRRNKRHDYFTSALPQPQKGPATPIAPNLDVKLQGTPGAGSVHTFRRSTTHAAVGTVSGSNFGIGGNSSINDTVTDLVIDPNGQWYTDTALATVNALREAVQIQRLYEKDNRGGTRYTEIIRAHFGVTSPDARLQRPEYLGSTHSQINFHPVAQTTSTDATTPQGNLAAFATGSSSGHVFTQSFTEHGFIMGIANVRADLTYQQGLERFWSRRTRFDYYWPSLSHLGEQAVLNKEIFVQGVDASDDAVFGYQERYAEYRYKPSTISGKFRSIVSSGSLDIWHLSQEFGSLPALNAAFMQEDPPIDRVIAVPAEPQFLLDTYFKVKSTRPMPVYSVPGMMDHF
jgi:hypothetical protein